MPLLDVALAFSLTMLVVAIVVTGIVRFMQNLSGIRKNQMKSMLKEYFDQELKPVVDREMYRLSNRVNVNVSKELSDIAKELGTSDLFTKDELKGLIEVSTEEMTEQLKRSPLGEKLLKEISDDAKQVFDQLSLRYEAIGKKFTESFRKHSRWWATGIALILAFCINIDTINIVSSYIKNENFREGVLAQMDAIMAKYDAQIVMQNSSMNDSTQVNLKQALVDTKEQIDFMKSVGFPIGWSYFPHVYYLSDESSDGLTRFNSGDWIMWILGIFLTALFAGLGAPFWYDTITGISRAAQRARVAKTPEAK